MKVILLYLVLGKLVFRAFQNVSSTTVLLLLVYTALSRSSRGHHGMVFKVKFHKSNQDRQAARAALCLT